MSEHAFSEDFLFSSNKELMSLREDWFLPHNKVYEHPSQKCLPASPTIETHLQSMKMLQVILHRLEMDIALSLLSIMATLQESVADFLAEVSKAISSDEC